jgi:hypothetical protein
MHRIFGLLALTATGLGLWVLFAGLDADPLNRGARAFSETPVGYSDWAMGLLMGLLLAWLATIDWRGFPERFGLWLRLQRRRLGLIILGGLCAGILLLF